MCAFFYVSYVDRRTIIKTSKAKAMEAAQEKTDGGSKYAIFFHRVLHFPNNVLLDL